MNLTKAVQEVAEWNERFQHIPEDDDTREKMWRYDDDWRLLAVRLVQEEVNELAEGSKADTSPCSMDSMLPREKDVEVLDAIADILFTVFGVAAKAGLTELVEPAFK